MKLLFALALLAAGPASLRLCQASAYAQGACCKVCKKAKHVATVAFLLIRHVISPKAAPAMDRMPLHHL